MAKWKAEDAYALMTNPTLAGIGPYEQVIPDDQWIEAAAKLIEEHGAEKILREMLGNLREAFPPPEHGE